jgi:glutamyl-tRNA synthetase
VVDDHDMAVTHVIRGDDHLTNAARQTQIYQAMGWNVPQWAHIPLIHGADGAKLSKRHGALGIDAYRDLGFLPVALRNYLVRLGWSHGNQEIFSDDEMVAAFDLGQIGRSPARFDFTKLESVNGHYMREADNAELVRRVEDLLPSLGAARGLGPSFTPDVRAKLEAAMDGLKERAKTLVELLDAAYYLYATSPLVLDAKAASLLDAGARERLAGLRPHLAAVADWTQAPLEAVLRAFADERGCKLGLVAQPLRAALTGRATSPGLFDVMVVLGREECLARLDAQGAPASSPVQARSGAA